MFFYFPTFGWPCLSFLWIAGLRMFGLDFFSQWCLPFPFSIYPYRVSNILCLSKKNKTKRYGDIMEAMLLLNNGHGFPALQNRLAIKKNTNNATLSQWRSERISLIFGTALQVEPLIGPQKWSKWLIFFNFFENINLAKNKIHQISITIIS